MPLDIWLAFAATCVAILAIPGPTVMVVVSYALGRGKASGWATVPGVTLGDFTAMTISLLGAGAILAASATLFTMLKLAGAAYLIWLGIQLWRAKVDPKDLMAGAKTTNTHGMFWNAYVVTALNPKSIVFFVAFVPQFVTTELPVLPQFVIMEVTFLVLAALNVAIWAVLAGEMRARFGSAARLRLVNRIGGTFLICAGLITATARRSA